MSSELVYIKVLCSLLSRCLYITVGSQHSPGNKERTPHQNHERIHVSTLDATAVWLYAFLE